MRRRISSYLTGENYASRAFRGSALTIFGFGVENILRLGSNLILTRLLFPEAFGLMALVQVVLSAAAMFSDFGIRGSIVQDKRGGEETFLNTAWTLQILRGIVLGLIIYISAVAVARFYEVPELADLLRIAAIVPILQGLNSTNLALANRTIQLGRVTILTLGSQTISIVVMIFLAWWLQSVLALVIGGVIGAAVLAGLSHIVLSGTRNRLAFERDAVHRLFSFGKYVFLSTLAGFVITQGDKLVLGKFVSLDDLAIYNIGFMLASMPMMLAGMLNDRVVYALYARRPPAESDNNRRKLNKARFLLTAGLVGIALLLAVIGDPLMKLLYDARYHGAGAVVTLIALAMLPRLITMSYERMPLASGHSGRFAFMTVTRSLVQLGLLIVGVIKFGVLGAILAPPIAVLLTYPLQIRINWPYRGWHAFHDAVFAGGGVCIIAGVLWLRWPVLAAFFQF